MDPIFMACPVCEKGVEIWADCCPYCGANLYAPRYEEEPPPMVKPDPDSPSLYDKAGLAYGIFMAGLLAVCLLVGVANILF